MNWKRGMINMTKINTIEAQQNEYMLNYIKNHYIEVYDEAEAEYNNALEEGEKHK